MRRGDLVKVSGDGLKFAARSLAGGNPDRAIRRGSVIRLQPGEKGAWSIAQVPKVEAALVALDPRNGAIHALAGGFDFNANKFNHVTQAWRQPGSSFKPFIYSAALEKGFTRRHRAERRAVRDRGGEDRRPALGAEELRRQVRGPDAPAHGARQVEEHGLDPPAAGDRPGLRAGLHPALRLRSRRCTRPTSRWRWAPARPRRCRWPRPTRPSPTAATASSRGSSRASWTTAARRSTPRSPRSPGEDAERVLDERNAFLMTNLMRDVVRYGTAARAMSLGRNDLAGKTGTTNDHIDAWFAGFQRQPGRGLLDRLRHARQPRARTRPGAWPRCRSGWRTCSKVLKDVPETELDPPSGVVAVNINPMTGLREPSGASRTIEYLLRRSRSRPWARRVRSRATPAGRRKK